MEIPRTDGAAPALDPELSRALAALGDAVREPLTPENLAAQQEQDIATRARPTVQELRADGLFEVDELRVPGRGVTLVSARPAGAAGPLPLLYYMHGGGMVVGNAPSVVPQLLREWALPSAWPSSPSSTAWHPRSGTPNRWRTATPASSGRPSTPASSASTRTASSSAARARAAASPRRSPCSPATGAVPRRSASCSCARCSTTATPPSPATRWPASTSGTAPPTPPGGRHSSATGSAPRTSRPTPPPPAPRTCPGSPGLHRRRVGRDLPGRGRGLRRRALAGRRPGRTARMARRLPRLRQPRPRCGPQPGRPRRPYALAPTRPHAVREPGDVGHTRPCHRGSGHLVSGM